MPRVAGVNPSGVALAALAMWFVGFLWYGVIFADVWMEALGITSDDFAGQSPLWMAAGFLIELVLAFGLAWLIKRMDVAGVGACVLTCLVVAVLIAVPVLAYQLVYQPLHSVAAWLIDTTHVLATFAAAGAILSYFD